jgi:hypothetical protein
MPDNDKRFRDKVVILTQEEELQYLNFEQRVFADRYGNLRLQNRRKKAGITEELLKNEMRRLFLAFKYGTW